MELVEGPTLADRIAHGPIPLDEALPIANDISSNRQQFVVVKDDPEAGRLNVALIGSKS
jgi:hypothetical protein